MTRLRPRLLLRDTRGSVALESLIAFAPLWLGFTALWQLSDLYMHELLVGRAATVAARAAAVVLPDDGAHYADPHNRAVHRFSGARKAAIEDAARAVLSAAPSLAGLAVTISGTRDADSLATARVSVEYTCAPFVVSALCAGGRTRRLEASAAFPYQFASYSYAEGE